MKIKKVETIEDLKFVVPLFDLYRQFYEQSSDKESAKKFLLERITKHESIIFLAMDEKSEAAMGFVQLYPSFSSVSMKRIWILNDLFVHEDYRQKGIAEELINVCKNLVRETNAKGLLLETHCSNTNAQRLYERTDFEKDDEHFYYFWEG